METLASPKPKSLSIQELKEETSDLHADFLMMEAGSSSAKEIVNKRTFSLKHLVAELGKEDTALTGGGTEELLQEIFL